MPPFSFARLADRSVLKVKGPEASHFLQGLITANIDDIDRDGAGASALLTPQGKVLFDFLVYKQDVGYLIDVPKAAAQDLLKRLGFYKLRSKVDISLMDDVDVFALWGTAPDDIGAFAQVQDPRLTALGMRVVAEPDIFATLEAAEEVDLTSYHQHRILAGVAEGLQDFDYSDIFPHDANFDKLGSVSFSKGCYVGQEVVSRVEHRGSARKRFALVSAKQPLPEMGTSVMVDGKSIGTLGSSCFAKGSSTGLALLRLDKAARAIENESPVTCGDVNVHITLPAWADFALQASDTNT